MRLTIARIGIFCTLLLWIVIFPLAAIRVVLQMPNLYLRWIRDGDIHHKVGQILTVLTFRYIPEHSWSPWINRHPDVVFELYDLVVGFLGQL